MAETEPQPEGSFAFGKQTVQPSRQPLQLYHLSHDLRGPLNSVLGFTELLLEGFEGPLTEIQIEDITAVRQSATNLLNLINMVVDLSRLEADRLLLAAKPVELDLVVAKVSEAGFNSAQAEVVVDLPEAMPPLSGDPERVEQMILHLIDFVLKRKSQGQIHLSAQSDHEKVTIQVATAEMVVAPEEIAELFELSVHVDAVGHSSLGKGGLTLPLVYRLAQKQQGRLWVESQADRGTFFYLQLPLYQSN